MCLTYLILGLACIHVLPNVFLFAWKPRCNKDMRKEAYSILIIFLHLWMHSQTCMSHFPPLPTHSFLFLCQNVLAKQLTLLDEMSASLSPSLTMFTILFYFSFLCYVRNKCIQKVPMIGFSWMMKPFAQNDVCVISQYEKTVKKLARTLTFV